MPLCIADFPNQQYYHGKLMTPPRAPCRPPQGFRWPSDDAICFIDAFGPGEERDKTSLYNAHEAHAIAECIYWLHDAGDVVSSDVVVLSFYQRQVKQIRWALQRFRLRIREVTTVDGFQGSDAPVVIVSTVRCNAFGHIGFAGDARRLNVAMTRACKALLIFGSRWTFTVQDGLDTWAPFFALSTCILGCKTPLALLLTRPSSKFFLGLALSALVGTDSRRCHEAGSQAVEPFERVVSCDYSHRCIQ